MLPKCTLHWLSSLTAAACLQSASRQSRFGSTKAGSAPHTPPAGAKHHSQYPWSDRQKTGGSSSTGGARGQKDSQKDSSRSTPRGEGPQGSWGRSYGSREQPHGRREQAPPIVRNNPPPV